jgi:hypothetical protein
VLANLRHLLEDLASIPADPISSLKARGTDWSISAQG